MNVIDGYMFEKYVAKIFEEAGYSVELEKRLEDRSGDIDIIAEKEAKRYCIEGHQGNVLRPSGRR